MAFPTGWGYKCSLTIDNTKVSGTGDLSNFPVLLTEVNFPSTIFDNTIATGADLRFTSDEAGTTELAFEVVNWDTTNDKAEVWVKVTTVDGDADTVFYAWYGNASATAYAHTDTYGTHAVWSNGFQGVWHLQGNFNDSSPNGYNLTESVSAPTDTTDGQIGSAKSFNKANSQHGYIASASCSNLSITGNMTFTGWLNPATTNTYMQLGGKRGEGSGTYPGYSLCTDTQRRLFWTHNGSQSAIASGTVTTGSKYYCVGVSDISNSKIKCSLNASSYVEASGSTGTATSAPFAIGCDYQLTGDTAGYFFNGMLDEIRVANVARTYDWIATEYNNQNAPATFVIEGTETSTGATTTTTSTSTSSSTSSSSSSSSTTTVAGTTTPSSSSSTSTSTSSTSTSSSSSTSTSTSTSTSSSSSSSTSSSSTTTEQIADYSRGDNAALGADDTDLENLFTWTEYQNVATNDGTRVAQTATNEYAEFLFKNKNDNTTDSIQVTWDGQSDVAPSSSTVYLQVYNRTTEEWETKDSDSTTGANTDFELTSTITSSLDDYYDVSGWVSCRVYQEGV